MDFGDIMYHQEKAKELTETGNSLFKQHSLNFK